MKITGLPLASGSDDHEWPFDSSRQRRDSLRVTRLAAASRVVGTERLELSWVSPHAPEACASTGSATSPRRSTLRLARFKRSLNRFRLRGCSFPHKAVLASLRSCFVGPQNIFILSVASSSLPPSTRGLDPRRARERVCNSPNPPPAVSRRTFQSTWFLQSAGC